MAQQENRGLRQFLSSRVGLVMLGFLAVAGYFLWQEHEAHILSYLPLILALGLCLGMHLFMHGGHGGHGGGGADNDSGDDER
jgi:hypothetical protein